MKNDAFNIFAHNYVLITHYTARIYVSMEKSYAVTHKLLTIVFLFQINNDPSAGSPTETLLRLLLPLNDQV